MKKTRIGVISLIAVLLLIAFVGMVYADRLVNATPEVQSIATSTSSNVQGTVTETDSGAWSLTGGPGILPDPNSPIWLGAPFDPSQSKLNEFIFGKYWIMWQDPITNPKGHDPSWDSYWAYYTNPANEPDVATYYLTLFNYALDANRAIHYTTGYNDQYSGVSGQQTFTKSMAISTANKIADQSNVKANTNIQFIAIDTGRATRTEDLLLDGAGNSTDTASAILCPFAQSVSAVVPPYCNIVQAGSAFDTTLTSTVTSADTRFIGTDSTFPIVLNYNINAQGITLGNQTSPMIGSVSAYLKVHVQEARNTTPTKSEDLSYSETSTASGLISKFSKSMSYQSGFNLI